MGGASLLVLINWGYWYGWYPGKYQRGSLTWVGPASRYCSFWGPWNGWSLSISKEGPWPPGNLHFVRSINCLYTKAQCRVPKWCARCRAKGDKWVNRFFTSRGQQYPKRKSVTEVLENCVKSARGPLFRPKATIPIKALYFFATLSTIGAHIFFQRELFHFYVAI